MAIFWCFLAKSKVLVNKDIKTDFIFIFLNSYHNSFSNPQALVLFLKFLRLVLLTVLAVTLLLFLALALVKINEGTSFSLSLLLVLSPLELLLLLVLKVSSFLACENKPITSFVEVIVKSIPSILWSSLD
jgi:hypothetical protein